MALLLRCIRMKRMIIEDIRLCRKILQEWIMRSGEDDFPIFSLMF